MDERHAWSVAPFVLRALLVVADAMVALVIGASTAQADDAQPADSAVTDPAGRSAPRTVLLAADDGLPPVPAQPAERALEAATNTVSRAGDLLPAVAPVTDQVTEVVSGATGETARRVDEVLAGAVRVVDDVVAPVSPASGSDRGTPRLSGSQSVGVTGAPRADQDRRSPAVRRPHVAPVTSAPPVVAPPAFAPGPAADTSAATPTPDLPLPTTILDLGAISGAPSAGSGGAGATAMAGLLPYAATAPAALRLGTAAQADDERRFALPLTPGWSPD